VRFLQYLPYFQSKGVEVTVRPLLSDAYLQALYRGGSRWYEVVRGYADRIRALLDVDRYDVVIVEKELFPSCPPLLNAFYDYLACPTWSITMMPCSIVTIATPTLGKEASGEKN
jgi:hypothetical protein